MENTFIVYLILVTTFHASGIGIITSDALVSTTTAPTNSAAASITDSAISISTSTALNNVSGIATTNITGSATWNSTSTAPTNTIGSATSISTSTAPMNITSTATSMSTSTAPSNITGSAISIDTISAPFDVDSELARIASYCMTNRNYEELCGYTFRYIVAAPIGHILIKEAVEIVGHTEMRAALGFAPVRLNASCAEPSEAEAETKASKVETYYNLKEPRRGIRCSKGLEKMYFFEKNYVSAVAFLDRRLPSVRTIFRRSFENVRRRESGVLVDRNTVDHTIEAFKDFITRINSAIDKMYFRTIECFKDNSFFEI